MKLVQIVPFLPPKIEGVGGYATVLDLELSRRLGIATRFLACSPEAADGLPATPERLLAALAEEEPDAVLLHYSGYGFHRRGCPRWLVAGLRRWRRRPGSGRLVTFFHEVYATGAPWRSSFWLSPVQRRLARELALLSDRVATSLDLYGGILGRWTGRTGPGRVAVLPVFSTVGEPARLPPLAARAPRLLVFGGSGTRRRTYEQLADALAGACGALGIEEVLDVGPAIDLPDRIAGLPLRRCGVLPAAEVSALMLDAVAGFLAYPAPFLPKSTVFAAYCAHGLVPVCAWPRTPHRAAAPGEPPYWTPGDGADPEEVAARARSWYDGHSLERQAEVFARMLEGDG